MILCSSRLFLYEYIHHTFVLIVPPLSVQITDDDGHKLKSVIGPYDEGAYLSLLCEAEGGKRHLLYKILINFDEI